MYFCGSSRLTATLALSCSHDRSEMNADVSDYYPNSETLTPGLGGKWSRTFFYFYSWTPDDVQRRKCTCLHSCWRPCETMHGQQKIRFILPSTSCFFFLQERQRRVRQFNPLCGSVFYLLEHIELNQWSGQVWTNELGVAYQGCGTRLRLKTGFMSGITVLWLNIWMIISQCDCCSNLRLLTNQEECSMKWRTDQHDTGANPHSCLASMFSVAVTCCWWFILEYWLMLEPVIQ